MYYSEKIIDGILHSKSHPNGAYKPLTPEQLTAKIVKLEKELFDATIGKGLVSINSIAC